LFGYFFVKARKALALLVIGIGIGFCVLEYSQADTSASATAYQPSTGLHRALTSLTDAFSAAQRLVNSFNDEHQQTSPNVQVPRFPAVVASSPDFDQIDDTLATTDRARQLLKESVVSRFETLVGGIETKLHAYAAGIESTSPSASNGAKDAAAPKPSLVIPGQVEESLFAPRLVSSDMNKRTINLNAQKEFLKVLESKAENPENRANLTEAGAQLDALSKLLPEKLEALTPSGTSAADQTGVEGR
jgi:hypothetical protein